MTELATPGFTPDEQSRVDKFLAETTLFLGPDPAIMRDHKSAPRTAEEDRLLSRPTDANALDRVRKRIIAGLDEAYEMMGQTGAAPGAKWGRSDHGQTSPTTCRRSTASCASPAPGPRR